MYSQTQLQSFFGSNYDASSLPVAITHNSVMAIVPFLVILLILFLIISQYKREKGKINLSSKELVVYKSGSQEDRNNNKQNIYNKYYFNVYVKQPYNKNGKKYDSKTLRHLLHFSPASTSLNTAACRFEQSWNCTASLTRTSTKVMFTFAQRAADSCRAIAATKSIA